MQISGEWYLCDDGMVRPVIRGEVRTDSGFWQPSLFLVDTSADRTVLSTTVLALLRLQPVMTREHIGGVGGMADAVVVETQVRFSREEAGKVVFRGQYAAVTELEALDMSVLGRDMTDMFAVIVDRPRDVVSPCLPDRPSRGTRSMASLRRQPKRSSMACPSGALPRHA